ncbi:MAG: hemolysin, partial [Fusobacterium gastrosuis]|nr:hemolysin [Fusobacterium gastrosuis]
TKSQKAAEYFSGLVMEKVKGVSSKEATDETYARIRNNKNVIIGEEGKKLADNIPMNDREYKIYQFSRPLDYSETYYSYKGSKWYNIKTGGLYIINRTAGLGTHGYVLVIPDVQEQFFDEKGELKKEYKDKNYPNPKKYGDKYGWTIGGHKVNGNLDVIFNQEQDKRVSQKILINDASDKLTPLSGYIGEGLKSSKYTNDTELVEVFMETAIAYENNNKEGISPKYGVLGQGTFSYYDSWQEKEIHPTTPLYNCNSFINTLVERLKIINFNKDVPGLDPGSNTIIEDKYFKTNK